MATKIIIASGNKKKLKEIQTMLNDLSLQIIPMTELETVPEIIEDELTFSGNALKKARTLFFQTGEWSLADDSGLEVDSLNGAPGVVSARFAGEPTDDKKNNEKLLFLLQHEENKCAQFRSIIALVGPSGEFTSEGIIRGRLISEFRGNNGFGYDPLFIPDGYEQTFAELSSEEKNKISHRAQALQKMKRVIVDQGI